MSVLAKPRNLQQLIRAFGMEDQSSTRREGLKDFLEQLQLSAGFNLIYSVNDCETVAEFTESTSGEFDVTATGSAKVGSNSITLTATTASVGYVETDDIVNSGPIPSDMNGVKQVDWRDTDYIGWWQQCNTGFNTAGELGFRIKNDGTWSAVQAVTAATDSVYQKIELDISALTRNKVEAIRFDNDNANAAEAVIIDHIIRYKFGNGKGPVLGPCMSYPIKSGVTLARGNLVEFEAGATRRIDLEAAAGTETLGPCVIGGTGDAQGTVFGLVQIGGLAYLRAGGTIVNGEGVQWNAAHTVIGATTGVDENNFAKAVEASTTGSDFLAFIAKSVTFVS